MVFRLMMQHPGANDREICELLAENGIPASRSSVQADRAWILNNLSLKTYKKGVDDYGEVPDDAFYGVAVLSSDDVKLLAKELKGIENYMDRFDAQSSGKQWGLLRMLKDVKSLCSANNAYDPHRIGAFNKQLKDEDKRDLDMLTPLYRRYVVNEILRQHPEGVSDTEIANIISDGAFDKDENLIKSAKGCWPDNKLISRDLQSLMANSLHPDGRPMIVKEGSKYRYRVPGTNALAVALSDYNLYCLQHAYQILAEWLGEDGLATFAPMFQAVAMKYNEQLLMQVAPQLTAQGRANNGYAGIDYSALLSQATDDYDEALLVPRLRQAIAHRRPAAIEIEDAFGGKRIIEIVTLKLSTGNPKRLTYAMIGQDDDGEWELRMPRLVEIQLSKISRIDVFRGSVDDEMLLQLIGQRLE